MNGIAHLPAGISDLAASLANCVQSQYVDWCLDRGVKKDAEARNCGDSPFKLMTSLMMIAG